MSLVEVAVTNAWQLWVVRVPSTALGNKHYLALASSVSEAFEIEAGSQATVLVAPDTTVSVTSDATSPVEFSTIATDVPLSDALEALMVCAQALAKLTGLAYAPSLDLRRLMAPRVSSQGPNQTVQVRRGEY